MWCRVLAFLLKNPGAVVAAVTVAAGILQYRITAKREFLKPVREAQLKLYQEASSAAAQIATLQEGTPERVKAEQEFLRLYYGPMAIVEDFDHSLDNEHSKLTVDKLTVESAMVIFKYCMDDDERETRKPGLSLEHASLALAHTFRTSVGQSWGYHINQLKGDYQKYAVEYWNNRNQGK